MNYNITWKYIVERMKSRYGFAPDSTEHLSMGELERYIQDIWMELFDKKYEAETKCEHCSKSVTATEGNESWYCMKYEKYCEDVAEGCVKCHDMENTH